MEGEREVEGEGEREREGRERGFNRFYTHPSSAQELCGGHLHVQWVVRLPLLRQTVDLSQVNAHTHPHTPSHTLTIPPHSLTDQTIQEGFIHMT